MRTRPDGYDIARWHANTVNRRPRRRWVAWAIVLGIAIAVAATLVEVADPGADTRRLPNILAYIPLMIGCGLSPFGRDAWFSARRATFDEFEEDALARAHRRSYAVLLGLVAALLAWLWAADLTGWPVPRSPADWATCGFALLAIGIALPVLLAEWLVPMPPPDDGDA